MNESSNQDLNNALKTIDYFSSPINTKTIAKLFEFKTYKELVDWLITGLEEDHFQYIVLGGELPIPVQLIYLFEETGSEYRQNVNELIKLALVYWKENYFNQWYWFDIFDNLLSISKGLSIEDTLSVVEEIGLMARDKLSLNKHNVYSNYVLALVSCFLSSFFKS